MAAGRSARGACVHVEELAGANWTRISNGRAGDRWRRVAHGANHNGQIWRWAAVAALIALLCQLIYNIEISRYTLYTGEPIFTGKFRTLPGPQMWVWIYLLQAVKLPDGYRFRDSTVSIRKEGEFCSQSNPTLGPLDFLKTFASTTQRSLVHRKAKHHPPRRLIPRRRHAVFAGYQHVHRRDNA